MGPHIPEHIICKKILKIIKQNKKGKLASGGADVDTPSQKIVGRSL